MNINVEKFLAITAALAACHVAGCSSSDSTPAGAGGADSGPGAGGATSAGGKTSTGGKTGTGGAKDGGAGGAKDGGSGGNTNKDASPPDSSTGGTDSGAITGPCLGDAVAGGFDAGSEGVSRCTLLPYVNDLCLPDSGMEGTPMALSVCSAAEFSMRPGAFAALVTCLAGINAHTCTPAHNKAALDCFTGVIARTCEKPKLDGGAADPCTSAGATACPGISQATCHAVLRSFTDESVNGSILPCLQAATLDGGSCAATFSACLPVGVTL